MRTPTTAQIELLEALTLATCPAEHELILGRWVLRASQSSVMRANTITVFAEAPLLAPEFAQRLQTAVAWYAQWGKKIHFRISEHPAAMAVDRALAALSYVQYDHTLVMHIADLSAAHLAAASTPWVAQPVDVGVATQWRMTTRGEPIAAAMAEAAAAQSYAITVASAPNALRNPAQCLLDNMIDSTATPTRQTQAVAIVDAGQNLIASGVARTCGLHVGLFNIYTAPHYRGKGCGQAITTALLQWAQHQGARTAFLQAEADNAAAIRIYQRLGFAAVYGYHYRRTGGA